MQICSLFSRFSARFVDFCRDDLRNQDHLLVEEQESSRDGAGRQRCLHQLPKLPHGIL